MNHQSKLELVKNRIKSYPDFPKKGVLFRDIFSVTLDCEVFNVLLDLLYDRVEKYKNEAEAIVGIESRGFLFGPILALKLGIPFIPIRKKGKLPGEVVSVEFSLEYGSDIVEAQKNSFLNIGSVVIVDDLLATGGTLKAACDLMTKLNVRVLNCIVIMELLGFRGKETVPATVEALIHY
ncbi:adenine phosphoribosyltransferase [Cimex lectularius]|uniref:Adenine phosphoribosyltransferase n=1 Tax=Cimex lectularius TaxID=79782 RepID=A0A8I6RY44_CIMLE|nr:adenine phosphoribosyltransferase [Cimex lectularius]